jgi:hypothetical protein
MSQNRPILVSAVFDPGNTFGDSPDGLGANTVDEEATRQDESWLSG